MYTEQVNAIKSASAVTASALETAKQAYLATGDQATADAYDKALDAHGAELLKASQEMEALLKEHKEPKVKIFTRYTAKTDEFPAAIVASCDYGSLTVACTDEEHRLESAHRKVAQELCNKYGLTNELKLVPNEVTYILSFNYTVKE